jgi:hypothetical protein
LQYNDLQSQGEFVLSTVAPPVFKKSGTLPDFFSPWQAVGAAKRTRRGRLPRRNLHQQMKPGQNNESAFPHLAFPPRNQAQNRRMACGFGAQKTAPDL